MLTDKLLIITSEFVVSSDSQITLICSRQAIAVLLH